MENRRKYLAAGLAAIALSAGGYALFSPDGDSASGNAAMATELPDGQDNEETASLSGPIPGEGSAPALNASLDASRPTDCLIEPSQVIRVNSGVEGVIQAIFVDRGDLVGRGQVVAQLRADVDRAGAAAAQARANNGHSIRAAEARASYLEATSRRSEEIAEFLADDAVEEARANANAALEDRNALVEQQRVARLEYAQTQQVLAEKTVRSPIAGIVTERVMSPGEYRGADASHIVTIAQVDPLYVEVFAPISQLSEVSEGDELTIIPEDPVGGEYLARIDVIDRVFDAASGTFGMRLELPNPDYSLPAGLRCSIRFSSNGEGSPRG